MKKCKSKQIVNIYTHIFNGFPLLSTSLENPNERNSHIFVKKEHILPIRNYCAYTIGVHNMIVQYRVHVNNVKKIQYFLNTKPYNAN